jgi:uncharacterized protein YndB with AHSA1/START domain
MTEIHLETEIRAGAESIFDAIVDLAAYDRWLPGSSAFPGITEISRGPIGVGTTYVESGPKGMRRGTITEFERPTRVTFQQPMTMQPKAFGVIGIESSYTLTPTGDSTLVYRRVEVRIPWQLQLVRPLVVRQFRQEGERTMLALKALSEQPRG